MGKDGTKPAKTTKVGAILLFARYLFIAMMGGSTVKQELVSI
jgi:hypothetical protein